jgi:hypothetical protein
MPETYTESRNNRSVFRNGHPIPAVRHRTKSFHGADKKYVESVVRSDSIIDDPYICHCIIDRAVPAFVASEDNAHSFLHHSFVNGRND